jgi:hypothetical protein
MYAGAPRCADFRSAIVIAPIPIIRAVVMAM